MATLLWFQHDLRINENPALNWALQQGKPIIAIYIHCPEEDEPWAPGAASCWWLHHSLEKLANALIQEGITLQFFKHNSVKTISQLARDYDIDSVVWTNRHEPQRMKYESELEQKLLEQGKVVQRFKDELLTDPADFLTLTQHSPYKVFTPFYKRLRQQLRLSVPFKQQRPKTIKPCPFLHADAVTLRQLELVDGHPWQNKLQQHWRVGEAAAIEKLESFISETLARYQTQRDFPALDGTSGISPHLHFGEISPRQIVNALAPLIEFEGGVIATEAEAFLRQLVWREFARYILWHFPDTSIESMNKKFTPAFWKSNAKNLPLWQRGKTGIPIIDAGMRQLWMTGTMHNRVRMLTASLLTKNMGIAWQHGARWFWDTLVDADLANNSMGWQWVAGCGVDAAPYFRIFNPLTQAKRFDAKQHYINKWLPGLNESTYPAPVVDLATSRTQSLQRYKQYISRGK